jgi:CheY-like chemotaxis protein
MFSFPSKRYLSVWLAVMDGFEATKRIREKEAQTKTQQPETDHRALPIVALTASATKVDGSLVFSPLTSAALV